METVGMAYSLWEGPARRKKTALTRAKVPFVPEELYFVRCLKSGFRFRPRKSDSDEPKVFECTNQCGQLFCRKGDWGRHERLNFEEWPCPHCGKVLSRCEHLRAHFKDAHPVEKDISKYQKRVFLTARQRPCGFCGSTLTDWSAWLAHVAIHFEEHREGGARAMSNWTDYRFLGEVEAEIVVTAPEEAMPGTMTASETQLDHVTSPALWREAETLDEQNEKDEKSARQVKHDGRDRYPLGRIGNHYNDSEPHFASVSEVWVLAGTSRRKERRPSFKDDQSHNPTHRHAGRHKPDRQASLYGGLSSSSSSDFLSGGGGGRHPNADRNKTEPPASDILGHRDTSDEDRDYTISHSTRPAALSRHQPTAYVSPRYGSSRHSRPPTHTAAFTEREREPYSNPPSKAAVDITDEEEDLPTPRPIERERKPYIAQPRGGKTYDQAKLEKVMSNSSQHSTMDGNKPTRSASILSNGRPPDQNRSRPIPITVHQRGPPSAMENRPMSANGMPAALSRHQPTAYVSGSSRHPRQPTPPILGHRDTSDEDHAYTISQSTRASALSKTLATAHESPRLGSARHARQPTSHFLGYGDTSDEDRDYTICQSTRSSALSKNQPTAHEMMRFCSARHARPPTPPMPASHAKRGVESEDPYDELESAYGAMRIRDSEPESAKPNRHGHESEPPESRHARHGTERHRHENDRRRR